MIKRHNSESYETKKLNTLETSANVLSRAEKHIFDIK